VTHQVLGPRASFLGARHLLDRVLEAAVGQLHGNNQLVVERPVGVYRKQVSMVQAAHQFQSLKLSFSTVFMHDRAVDDLEGTLEAAGCLGPVDFAKPSPADAVEEFVAAADGQEFSNVRTFGSGGTSRRRDGGSDGRCGRDRLWTLRLRRSNRGRKSRKIP